VLRAASAVEITRALQRWSGQRPQARLLLRCKSLSNLKILCAHQGPHALILHIHECSQATRNVRSRDMMDMTGEKRGLGKITWTARYTSRKDVMNKVQDVPSLGSLPPILLTYVRVVRRQEIELHSGGGECNPKIIQSRQGNNLVNMSSKDDPTVPHVQ
jgi:hypothetical protein